MQTGWLLGFAIGAAVVIVVVVAVLTIVWLAGRIRDQARRAVDHLERAEGHTAALWDLDVTARAATDAVDAVRRLRGADGAPTPRDAGGPS